jgi:hypothetical protein
MGRVWLALPVMALVGCAGPMDGLKDPSVYSAQRDTWPHAVRAHAPTMTGNDGPLLTMAPGVPYDGCMLTASTDYGSGSGGCAVTMASLLGRGAAVAQK